jgi:formylglycine-generating enzyme required for sulfatase activity
MNPFRLSLFSLFLFLQNFLIAQEPIRTWTSSEGRTLEARFIEQVGSNVRIKNEAEREFTLPISRFSQADQEYVVEAVARAFFQSPEAFEDRGKGAIIIASVTGKVTVIPAPRYSGSQEVKPVARNVIVGEPLPHGSTILTGANSAADLLLTTGSLAKVGPNSKLVLSAFWQEGFRASAKKVTDLKEETSPSRVAFKLETGDLVVEVKKLNRESSFMIESPVGVAGIRGTQFGLSADSDSTELAVLEGRVRFLDTNQKAKSVTTAQKISGSEDGAGELNTLSESEKAELAKAVVDSQESASEYDLTRLANTVEGFAQKPNYIVKSALNMELIWCQSGSFKLGDSRMRFSIQVDTVVLKNGFYLGKYEVTQDQYEKVMGVNPSGFKGKKLPVENVSWNDAKKFCNALTKMEKLQTGWSFVLPTSAEWEYACRAGTTTRYSWGDEIKKNVANFSDAGINQITKVGSFPSNNWGFYDMHGNVTEWVNDWKSSLEEMKPLDPQGASSGSFKFQRGGNWKMPISNEWATSSGLTWVDPSHRHEGQGFRVALKFID